MKTDCEKCSKPTWKGCGRHIEQALKDVPEDERCKCPRDPPVPTTTENKETAACTEVKTEEAKVETTEVKTEEAKFETTEVKTEEAKVETTATTEEPKEKVD